MATSLRHARGELGDRPDGGRSHVLAGVLPGGELAGLEAGHAAWRGDQRGARRLGGRGGTRSASRSGPAGPRSSRRSPRPRTEAASWSAGGPLNADGGGVTRRVRRRRQQAVALLSNGTIETSSDAGGHGRPSPSPVPSRPPRRPRDARPVKVTSVSFGDIRRGCAGGRHLRDQRYHRGVLLHSGRRAGSGSACRWPGSSVRLTGGMALVQGKSGLSALWNGLGVVRLRDRPRQPSSSD